MTSEAWLRAGGSDSLIRLSVVVEVCEDMLADLEQAIVG
jgi:O-acetylhomoserine/O-acetylserine sulfhydrylase-like pyridoxal-dependent enzyme